VLAWLISAGTGEIWLAALELPGRRRIERSVRRAEGAALLAVVEFSWAVFSYFGFDWIQLCYRVGLFGGPKGKKRGHFFSVAKCVLLLYLEFTKFF
jgi:hypothetical protein